MFASIKSHVFVYIFATFVYLEVEEKIFLLIIILILLIFQIEALKSIGVDEVVLAINYQPEVKIKISSLHYLVHY